MTNSSLSEGKQALRYSIETYKKEHRELLESDPEFARWLEESYVPIAGGWQY